MLTGLTVVDFSRYLPGPVCTMRLADKGADVIKVESFPMGDPGRTLGPKYGDDSTLFISSNRNKKSVAINLRTEQGRDLALQLAIQADVIVESYRPGVMQHLGLDFESIRAHKPDIIYCSLTGYGQYGTMHQLGGHDLNYQAVSGLLGVTKDSEGRPILSEIPIADYVGGLYASEQILAALVQKALKGQGAYLDIASTDVLASWMGMHVMLAELGGKATMNHFLTELFSYNIYETADGRYVALAALEDKFWQNFCRAVGRLDWEDITERSITRYPEMYEELKALFLMRTQFEWNELGTEVDCCLTAVEELDTWLSSPYVTGRNLPFSFDTRQTGSLVHIRTSLDQPNDGTDPPMLGEHTWSVLQEKLGVSIDQLNHFAELRIIPKGEKSK